ncbi:hypothetical protein MMC19_007545 [Ptychographa xylographoides]|nr:hypothetical protein [Ptychographa xylographoides]
MAASMSSTWELGERIPEWAKFHGIHYDQIRRDALYTRDYHLEGCHYSTELHRKYNREAAGLKPAIIRTFKPTPFKPFTGGPAAKGLGVFAKLPAELRGLIWKEFTPEFWTCNGNCNFRVGMAILQTSKQIYKEASAELYRGRILKFHVSPDKQDLTFKDLPRPDTRVFGYTDYTQFKAIEVIVEPPDSLDPGQLIRIRNFVKAVVTVLARTAGLPSVKLILLETENLTWCVGNQPQHSSSWAPLTVDEPDIMIILKTFQFIRKVKGAQVVLPANLRNDIRIQKYAKKLEENMMSISPFGSVLDDEVTVDTERATTLKLDWALDSLEGKTAADLRLKRFIEFDSYPHSFVTMLYLKSHTLRMRESDQAMDAYEQRMFAYLVWNPRSYDIIREEYDAYEAYLWNDCHRRGIPPKGSVEWDNFMSRNAHRISTDEYKEYIDCDPEIDEYVDKEGSPESLLWDSELDAIPDLF